MEIKRIISSIYRSAPQRSAPEWPERLLRYSAVTPVPTGVASYCKQEQYTATPLTPVVCASAANFESTSREVNIRPSGGNHSTEPSLGHAHSPRAPTLSRCARRYGGGQNHQLRLEGYLLGV
jgi:hypothetical protein